jgi:deaminated glutathione amidase
VDHGPCLIAGLISRPDRWIAQLSPASGRYPHLAPQAARIVAQPKLTDVRIALAQILSGTDPAANLQLVREYAGQAADAGAKLVVFPEATMCRFGVPLGAIAEPVDGPWAHGVKQIATEAGITVIAGMFTPAGDGRVTNTLIAAGPGTPNQPDTHYDKIHLYDAFGFTESRTVAPGHEPVVMTVDDVQVGLTICYDIRFPALYTELARRGAALIVVCASWGSGPGKLEQWTLLARARALDSTSYVAAAGQADPGSDLTSNSGAPTGVGGSLVASPLGEVVASAGADPQLVIADIDLDSVATARENIAVLSNQSSFAQVNRAESRG